MKVYTVADIQALKPCSNHDPLTYVDITWSGTIIDILKCTQVNLVSRFWVVYRLLDDKTLRLFAVACARRALTSVVNPDIRSVEACNIAEKYANGEATKDELTDAAKHAYDAAAAYTAHAAYAAAAATTAAAAFDAAAAADHAAYAAYAAAADYAVYAAYAADYAAAAAAHAGAEHAGDAAEHAAYAAYTAAYVAYAAAYVAYAAAGATTAADYAADYDAAAAAERQWQVECLINMLK